jgi:hypothetical protein
VQIPIRSSYPAPYTGEESERITAGIRNLGWQRARRESEQRTDQLQFSCSDDKLVELEMRLEGLHAMVTNNLAVRAQRDKDAELLSVQIASFGAEARLLGYVTRFYDHPIVVAIRTAEAAGHEPPIHPALLRESLFSFRASTSRPKTGRPWRRWNADAKAAVVTDPAAVPEEDTTPEDAVPEEDTAPEDAAPGKDAVFDEDDDVFAGGAAIDSNGDAQVEEDELIEALDEIEAEDNVVFDSQEQSEPLVAEQKSRMQDPESTEALFRSLDRDLERLHQSDVRDDFHRIYHEFTSIIASSKPIGATGQKGNSWLKCKLTLMLVFRVRFVHSLGILQLIV